MMRTVSLLTLLGPLASAAAADPIPPQPVEGLIRWVYDYAEGRRQARSTGKPLFVVFRCER